MDKQELFALRELAIKDFDSPKEFRIFLEDLLGEKRELPLVVGLSYSSDYLKGEWRVMDLKKRNEEDRDVVNSYLEGLSHFDTYWTDTALKGEVSYKGIDSLQDIYGLYFDSLPFNILSARLFDPTNPGQNFNLNLDLAIFTDRTFGYAARSEITTCAFAQDAKHFVSCLYENLDD